MFFFFKQKTAYEMRISDWSSDVCSSDLVHASYANAANRVLDKEPGMTIGVAQLRPESRGSIHIKSPNPLDGPAIRPNFLDAAADRDSLSSEERRVGKECVSTCSSGWSPDH